MTPNRAFGEIKSWLVQPPLRLLIVVPFLLQIFAAVGVTGWLYWHNSQAAVRVVAEQLVEETSDRILDQLQTYAAQPKRLNKVNIRAAQLGLLDLTDIDTTQQYFMQQLMLYEDVTFIGFGNEAGEFVGVNRRVDGQFQLQLATQDTGGALQDYLLDAQGNRLNRLNTEPNYDVRQRPWYADTKAADGAYWSDAHPYFASEGLALSVNELLRAPDGELVGVIGVGYDLSLASEFLGELDVGQTGETFIIERTGYLIASSLEEKPYRPTTGGSQRLLAFESDNILVRFTASYLRDRFGGLEAFASPTQIVINHDGEREFVRVAPFQDGSGLDWLTVVVVPETDFTAQLHASTRTTAALCVVALAIATGLGAITSRYIAQPLLVLNRAAKAIARGQLRQTIAVGPIREVSELAGSFNQMAIQLQAAFQQLQAVNAALFKSENRLYKFMEALPVGVIVINVAGEPTYLNRVSKQILGLNSTEVWPEQLSDLFQIRYADSQQPYEEADLPGLRALQGEVVHLDNLELQRRGEQIPLEVWATPIFDEGGRIIYSITAFQDVSDRKRAEQHLIDSALHDEPTDLPNRHFFVERIRTALQRAEQDDTYQFAVLFVDLDQFKLINDSFGHIIGDLVLFSVARKLQVIVRTQDLVARFGGDEFVILIDAVDAVRDAVCIAERIAVEFALPLSIQSHHIGLTASIGIVMGQTYCNAVELLRDADIALYRAKAEGRAQYKIFDDTMHGHAIALMTLENNLRRGLEGREFMLHYQPIVALDSQKLVGFEALARWQTATDGLLFPKDFIGAAENSGLIVDIDFELIRIACRQLVAWQQRYPHASRLRMSINLSVHDIRSPQFVEYVTEVLAETGLLGEWLTLEITESVLLNLDDFEKLLPLKDRGIQISIDDFGTGYSSLSYLCWLPVNMLKVDQSFIHQMSTQVKSQMIVQTIVSLGHQLNLKTTAEGIETSAQLELLYRLGCHFGQGHLFSTALSAEAVEKLLSNPQADGSIVL